MTMRPTAMLPVAASAAPASSPRDPLRQMLALLEGERQALAALDLERIITCTGGKLELCALIERCNASELDAECRGLLDAVKRLNEINRKLRNLLAGNIEARLGTLTGSAMLYSRAAATPPIQTKA